MPVPPAILDAEVGELLEPGGRGCSEPKSHHCTPAWAKGVRLGLKKKKKTTNQTKKVYYGCEYCSLSSAIYQNTRQEIIKYAEKEATVFN